jgi:hypothetical protein
MLQFKTQDDRDWEITCIMQELHGGKDYSSSFPAKQPNGKVQTREEFLDELKEMTRPGYMCGVEEDKKETRAANLKCIFRTIDCPLMMDSEVYSIAAFLFNLDRLLKEDR